MALPLRTSDVRTGSDLPWAREQLAQPVSVPGLQDQDASFSQDAFWPAPEAGTTPVTAPWERPSGLEVQSDGTATDGQSILRSTHRLDLTGADSGLPGGLKLAHPVSVLRITSPFGWRKNPTGPGHHIHIGQDYAIACGTPVRAAEAGRVVQSAWAGHSGQRIRIDHGHGIETAYSHNSLLIAQVGDTVEQGALLALSGTTGNSTGCHLHFEVYVNGHWTNPALYLPRIPGQPAPMTPRELVRVRDAKTPSTTPGANYLQAGAPRPSTVASPAPAPSRPAAPAEPSSTASGPPSAPPGTAVKPSPTAAPQPEPAPSAPPTPTGPAAPTPVPSPTPGTPVPTPVPTTPAPAPEPLPTETGPSGPDPTPVPTPTAAPEAPEPTPGHGDPEDDTPGGPDGEEATPPSPGPGDPAGDGPSAPDPSDGPGDGSGDGPGAGTDPAESGTGHSEGDPADGDAASTDGGPGDRDADEDPAVADPPPVNPTPASAAPTTAAPGPSSARTPQDAPRPAATAQSTTTSQAAAKQMATPSRAVTQEPAATAVGSTAARAGTESAPRPGTATPEAQRPSHGRAAGGDGVCPEGTDDVHVAERSASGAEDAAKENESCLAADSQT
ncbi:peptidoglycan DD-metalloendopeptidase family protein [Zafaria sp. Z1313]|uniref:M23 family metallopeptidase n=1 Tax=Zafaria sp. Z1313 TaxID=3423202 RepID=UPI003D303706